MKHSQPRRHRAQSPGRSEAIYRSLTLILAGLLLSTAGCAPRKPANHPRSPAVRRADFVDIALRSGLKFSWTNHSRGPWTNIESFGCGCAFVDYDNDGWMDILLVGRPRCALFHNNHNGTFTDVTARAGITQEGAWTGVAVGDYDNDGYEDIYVSGFHCSMLLHNDGHGGFKDVTRRAGLNETQWGTSCAWIDADNDGRLDLLVGHYVITGPGYPKFCPSPTGVLLGCRPEVYPPQFPRLYHNNGNGTFSNVTIQSGLGMAHGKALAIQTGDFDNDGKTDFYIANDGVAGDMFHNLGGGRFENVSFQQGTAFDARGLAQAGMGVDFADYDHDGTLDMVVTAFQNETFSLYQQRAGLYSLTSTAAGLASTTGYLGFGVKFFDYDNDSWPDLVFANGHVYNNVRQVYPNVGFRQPLLLFHNDHGYFHRVVDAGPAFQKKIVGRGIAVGDVMNDGNQELLVVDYDGRPMLIRNRRPGHNHWLGVKLVGARSNRDGYGARVTVRWPGGKSFADCSAAGSYLSSMDPRLHFGLAGAIKVTAVEVRWPSGHVQTLHPRGVDRYITIRES
ncbi:MAG TPA: CRTAC1 family protein [Armatimonadota bacterium]|nr:CRTAC1 family protein [Armatimonadota bacterium]